MATADHPDSSMRSGGASSGSSQPSNVDRGMRGGSSSGSGPSQSDIAAWNAAEQRNREVQRAQNRVSASGGGGRGAAQGPSQAQIDGAHAGAIFGDLSPSERDALFGARSRQQQIDREVQRADNATRAQGGAGVAGANARAMQAAAQALGGPMSAEDSAELRRIAASPSFQRDQARQNAHVSSGSQEARDMQLAYHALGGAVTAEGAAELRRIAAAGGNTPNRGASVDPKPNEHRADGPQPGTATSGGSRGGGGIIGSVRNAIGDAAGAVTDTVSGAARGVGGFARDLVDSDLDLPEGGQNGNGRGGRGSNGSTTTSSTTSTTAPTTATTATNNPQFTTRRTKDIVRGAGKGSAGSTDDFMKEATAASQALVDGKDRLSTALTDRNRSPGGAVQVGTTRNGKPLYITSDGMLADSSHQGTAVPYGEAVYEVTLPNGQVRRVSDMHQAVAYARQGATLTEVDVPQGRGGMDRLVGQVEDRSPQSGVLTTNMADRARSPGGGTQVGTAANGKPLYITNNGMLATSSNGSGAAVPHGESLYRVTFASGEVREVSDVNQLRDYARMGATLTEVAGGNPGNGHVNRVIKPAKPVGAAAAAPAPAPAPAVTANNSVADANLRKQLQGIASAYGEKWDNAKIDQLALQVQRGQRTLSSIDADVSRRVAASGGSGTRSNAKDLPATVTTKDIKKPADKPAGSTTQGQAAATTMDRIAAGGSHTFTTQPYEPNKPTKPISKPSGGSSAPSKQDLEAAAAIFGTNLSAADRAKLEAAAHNLSNAKPSSRVSGGAASSNNNSSLVFTPPAAAKPVNNGFSTGSAGSRKK